MSTDRVNQWLTLIANISVVAGIIFLAIEVRQNTESQDEFTRVARANAYQTRAFAASSLWSDFASSPEIVESLIAFNEVGGLDAAAKALAALSSEDQMRMFYIGLAQVAVLDNNFYQYKEGYLDADRYRRIDAHNLRALIPLFDALGFEYPTEMAEEVVRLRRQ